MFTHVMVGSNDPARSKKFYDAALGALGKPAGVEFRPGLIFYPGDSGSFGVGSPYDGKEASYANGGTIGFQAETKEQVDAFHAAGLANGGSDEGAPGKRPQAPGNAYGAYLRDPDGNKICSFCQLPDGE